MGRETFESANARAFIERMLSALSERRMTRAEMEEELFASKSKMINYIRFLHGGTGAEKRIYICTFVDAPNGGRVPRYAVGNKRDAKPRGARTMAQRWARTKADPIKHAIRLAKMRAKAREKGIPARSRATLKLPPASWAAALGV